MQNEQKISFLYERIEKRITERLEGVEETYKERNCNKNKKDEVCISLKTEIEVLKFVLRVINEERKKLF